MMTETPEQNTNDEENQNIPVATPVFEEVQDVQEQTQNSINDDIVDLLYIHYKRYQTYAKISLCIACSFGILFIVLLALHLV